MLRNIGLSLLALGIMASCTQHSEDSAPETAAQVSQDILEGFPATDAKYGAVGALVEAIDIPGYGIIVFNVFCSGTLIGPHAVLTARHCTPRIDNPTYPDLAPYFAFGDNAWEPEQLVPVTGYVAAPASPDHPGLLLDGGRDVAVAYLADAPAGIVPAQLGHFEESLAGTQFEIAGFGYSDPGSGVKFGGLATVRVTGGRWYEHLFFGDKQAYYDWYFTDAFTSPTQAEADQWWNVYVLEPGYEWLVGGLTGDALSCFGDSGGPLFAGASPESFTVYGVSFAVESSLSDVCTLGNAYAVLHKKKLGKFVADALAAAP